MEKTILGYTSFLKEKKAAGELQDYAPNLRDLSLAGNDCGTKLASTAIAILNQAYSGKVKNLNIMVSEKLQNLRFQIFEESVALISGNEQSADIDVHTWQLYMKLAHQMGLSIPGSEGTNYEDVNVHQREDRDLFHKTFNTKY